MADAPDWDDIPDFDNLPDAQPEASAPQEPAAPEPAQPQAQAAPNWDDIPDFDSLPDQAPQDKPAPEGALATAARRAAHGVIPTFGSLPAIGAGAIAGSAFGPVGSFVGGVLGGIGGGMAVSSAQEFALKHIFGLDDSTQMAVNAEAHPIASAAGDVLPAAAAFRFDKAATIGARLAGAGVMGGLDVGQQLGMTGKVDPYEAAAATASGALLTKPTARAQKGLDMLAPQAQRVADAVSKWRNGQKARIPTPVTGDDANPQAAGGASVADTPPIREVDVGDPQNQPSRSDRDYGVGTHTDQGVVPTVGDMDPATLSALQNSLNQNELRAVPADASELPNQPKPESVPPIQTGIEEAAAQQPQPAAPQQAAPEPPVETGLEVPPAPETAQSTSTFQTSKGSTYAVHEDGTTTRNKSDHTSAGHAADDVGPKPRSAKTVYLTREQANMLSPPDGHFAIIDHGDGTLSTATKQKQNGKWGIAEDQRNIPYTTEPAIGLHPLELWGSKKVQGHDAFGALHFGNDIVSTAGEKPVRPGEAPTPTPEAVPPLVQGQLNPKTSFPKEPPIETGIAEAAPTQEPPPWESLPEKPPAAEAAIAKSKKGKKTLKLPPRMDRLENYFRPGRVVKGYGGMDTVNKFTRGEDGHWSVEVTGDDGRVRNHETMPDERDLRAWEKNNPVPTKKPSLPERAAEVREAVHPEPSPAQIEAENFPKGHPGRFAGHEVSIETAKEGIRRSKPGAKEPWEVKMPYDYGHLLRTRGNDGDPLDIAIGEGNKHFIIDQREANTGKFDEHKIFSHFKSEQDAIKHYKAGFSDGRGDERLMGISPVTEDTIKNFAENGDTSRPFGRDVTANGKTVPAVKRPTVVTKALEGLRAAGMDKAAAAIESLPPDRQAVEAVKANAMLTNKTGKVPSAPAEIRVRSKPPEIKVGDVTVTANSKASAERKAGALRKLNAAFEASAPAENETRQATVDRLTAAVRAAGTALQEYRPNVKPKEWLWMREAKRFLEGSKSDAKHQQFIADELQLRSGNAEDVANVRNTGRIDSDIGMSRRSGEDAITSAENEGAKGYMDVPHEEAETMVKPTEVKTSADLIKRMDREIDLTDPEQLAKVKEDSDKISENLIKEEDKDVEPTDQEAATKKRLAYMAEQRRAREAFEANPDKQRRSREAASLVSRTATREPERAPSPVRKIAIDGQSAKAALDALEKAQARDRSRSAPEPLPPEKERTEVSEESALKRFWNNERGSLDLNKIKQDFKAGVAALRTGLEKYFGVPIGDVGIKADSVFARAMSEKNKWQAEKQHLLDARYYQWQKNPDLKVDSRKYLSTIEDPQVKTRQDAYDALIAKGLSAEKADWMADDVEFHKDLMNKIWLEDKAHGSQAGYVENYVSHIFEDPKGATQYMEQRIQALGPRWYQKSRVFDMIAEAEKAGFKLKYDNPMQIVNARWSASINANMLVASARGLHDIGLAFPSKGAPSFAKKWMQLSLPDHQVWHIAPGAENLWKNAMDAKGFIENEHVPGNVVRAWMKLKNVWVPFQLFFSGFHELHVAANINPAVNISRALQLSRHNPAGTGRNLLNAVKWSLKDPLLALPIDKIGFGIGKVVDDWSGKAFSEFAGRNAMNWWQQPKDQLSPTAKMWTQLFKEGGMSPYQAEEERINAKRAFKSAMQQGEYGKAIMPGLRRALEIVQEPMFKYQIPALKNIAYMRNVEAAIKMDPSLITDNVRRGVVLRSLGKNIDDRFGEMFYKTLFWNKYAKDAGIASMLSLSWNLGQAHQVAGAVANLRRTARMAGGPNGMGSPMAEAKYRAGDKATFVGSYVGLSMASSGLISYAMSGELPSGLDWVFPRNGLKNNDGSPARLSTPFNTREPFMLIGHAQQHNSWIGGAMEFLWNKMILAPLVEIAQNKDFYGNKLYDTNAPWYKKALQTVDSVLGAHMSVVSMSGADRAKQAGGGVGQQAMAYAGFAPAPKYVSASAMENRINALFADEGTPYNRPYEYGAKTGLGRGLVQGAIRNFADDPLKSEARRDARQRVDRSVVDNNPGAARDARRDLVTKGGMSPRTVGKLGADQEFQYKFSRLPEDTQISLARDMDAKEFNRFILTNRNAGIKRETRSKIIKERGVPSR